MRNKQCWGFRSNADQGNVAAAKGRLHFCFDAAVTCVSPIDRWQIIRLKAHKPKQKNAITALHGKRYCLIHAQGQGAGILSVLKPLM